MNIILEGIPANSISVSLASYVFVLVNVTNSLTVSLSVVFVRLSCLDANRVNIPAILNKLVAWKRKSTKRVSVESRVDKAPEIDQSNVCSVQDIETVAKGSCLNSKSEPPKDSGEERSTKAQAVSWCDVAHVLDELYFKFLFVFVVASIIVVLLVLWSKKAF